MGKRKVTVSCAENRKGKKWRWKKRIVHEKKHSSESEQFIEEDDLLVEQIEWPSLVDEMILDIFEMEPCIDNKRARITDIIISWSDIFVSISRARNHLH